MGFYLTPRAEADLDGLSLYVARQSRSIDIANRVLDNIGDRFWLLGQHPHLGRRRDRDLRPGLRSFPAGEYVIIYRMEESDVLILHVMRGTRDIENLLADQ